MPAVAKVSDDEVIAAARRLVERHGPTALSMQGVADEVGVKAPSLYKRFADRAALLVAVQRVIFADLGRRLDAAATPHDAAVALTAMAHAYRRFARSRPHAYALMFATELPHDLAGDEARRSAAQPVLTTLSRWLGPEAALPTARVFTAFVHGFVSMELAGAFRLGGDVDRAFERGLQMLIGSIDRPPGATR